MELDGSFCLQEAVDSNLMVFEMMSLYILIMQNWHNKN